MAASIYLAILMAMISSALTQQYLVSQDGMVAMVTDNAGSPIYAQMAPVAPAAEDPVIVSMGGDEVVATDAAVAVDPRFRLAFRSNGNGGSYLTMEPEPAPVPIVATYAPAAPVAPAPLTSGYTYGQKVVQLHPVMAPARFLPTELAEGVSIPQIPGVAGVDYPIFSQALTSSFHCEDQPASGYYADVEAKCQVFHICEKDVEKFAFLCPNGTMFNEKHSVCDWWYNVRCEKPAPAPLVNGYGYPTTTSAPPAPIVQSYYSQVAPEAPVATDTSDAEALRRLRHQLRVNRLRNGNGGGYAQTVEEPAPEVAAIEEQTGYQSQASANGGRKQNNRLRSNVRFNGFRNEAGSGYQHTSEVAPAVEEPLPEPAPEVALVVETGYQSQASNGGRQNRNRLRSNVRFNGFRNEAGSGYQHTSEVASAVEESLPEPVPEVAPVVETGYQSQASNGGRQNRNRLRSNVRFNGFRNEAGSGYQHTSEVAPAVEEPLPEPAPEVAPVVETGYQSQASNGGRKNHNRLRSNVRFNGFRNEVGSGYHQVAEEVQAVEEPVPEVAPVEETGYQSSGGRKGSNRLRSNVRVRFNGFRNEGTSGYHQQTTEVAAPAEVVASGYQQTSGNGNGGRNLRTKSHVRFNGFRNNGGYHQTAVEEAAPEVAPETAVDEVVEPEVVPPAYPGSNGGGRRIVNRLRQMIGSGLRFNGLRNAGYAQPEPEVAPEVVPEVVAEVAPEVAPETTSYPSQNGGRKFRTNRFRQVFRATGNGYGLPPPPPPPTVEEPEVVTEVVSEVAAPEVPAPTAYGQQEVRNLLRANQFRFSKGRYEAAAVAPPAVPEDETVVAVVNGNGETVANGNDEAVSSEDATVVVLDEGGRTAATIRGKGAFRVNHKGQVRLTHRARSMLRNMMRPQRVFRRNGRRNVNAFLASARNFNAGNVRFFRKF